MHFTKSAPKASRFFSTKVLDVYSTGPATHGTMAPWDNRFFLWPLHLMTSVVIEMRILQNSLLLCTVIEFVYLTISENNHDYIIQKSNKWHQHLRRGPAKWCTTKLFCLSFTTSKWRLLPCARCILEHQPSELPPVVMHSWQLTMPLSI